MCVSASCAKHKTERKRDRITHFSTMAYRGYVFAVRFTPLWQCCSVWCWRFEGYKMATFKYTVEVLRCKCLALERIYNLQVKYVGAKSILTADTLFRLSRPGTTIPGLDVGITEVLTVKPTILESLQDETKTDSELSPLCEHITRGWPDRKQELPSTLELYWCFRDELAILDGLIIKDSHMVVPSALHTETLSQPHDGGHQGLIATLQRDRCTVYWPNLQDNISAMIQCCTECQVHANKKPRSPEQQPSACHPMEILGIDLMEFTGQSALISVNYFSGYLTIDYIQDETSATVITSLDNNFRKFGLAERIISDGPCFKSEKFRKFCNTLEIEHTTSSPHYHDGNGRAERAIQTVKQIMKKTKTAVEMTMTILAYHNTTCSSDLPSPAELFFNRIVNTRVGLMYRPTTLSDEQKTRLCEKRAAHLPPSKMTRDDFTPEQPIWYTEDDTPEWKLGRIETRDPLPSSYWIISTETGWWLRENKHDIKPCFHQTTIQPPEFSTQHYMPPPPEAGWSSRTQCGCTTATYTGASVHCHYSHSTAEGS